MRTSLLIAVLMAASFILGFGRDILIARQLGAGWAADLLFVCLVLPVFFENLVGIALRDAMIPYLQHLRLKDGGRAPVAERRLYTLASLQSLILAASVALLSPWLLQWLAPGWSEPLRETARPAFMLASALIAAQTVLYAQAALLNLDGRFITPMWRTVLFNLGAIVALVVWQGHVGAVLAGMLLGLAVLATVQHRVLVAGPIVRPAAPQFPTSAGSARTFAGTFLPLLAGTAAQQICVVAERVFASWLDEGSIARLSFAFRITTVPLTLFALSVLTVLYPRFSRLEGQRGRAQLESLHRASVKITLAILVPFAILFAIHPSAVVAVLLQRGQFDAVQTAATAPLVAAYAASLPAMGLALLWSRILLSQSGARAFFACAVVASLTTILLDSLLYRQHGAFGLAVAFSAGAWLQAGMMAWCVRSRASLPLGGLGRWLVVATLMGVLLHLLALPQSIAGLAIACVVLVIGVPAALAATGEREMFRRKFWIIAAGSGDDGQGKT